MEINDLKKLLDRLASEYNVPSFTESDPVQFPRRFSDIRDIEITALLVSTISWGKRAMILRNAERLLGLLNHQPYHFVMEGNIDEIDDANIHRTFFGRHLKYFLTGLRAIYSRHSSLEEFSRHNHCHNTEAPAWELARLIRQELQQANASGQGIDLCGSPERCLPANVDISALKRFNMALRWLVRNDGVVDLGVWTHLKPSQLYIPLDVHVGNTSRELGLLTRRQNDRRATVELTQALRRMRPDDPTVYDFALFGYGVNKA